MAIQPSGYTYDVPYTPSYSLGSINFATTTAATIKRPPNVRFAKIIDVNVDASVLFTNVTTGAFVRIGTAADPDKFAELTLGALAANASFGVLDDDDAILAAGQLIDLDTAGDAGVALTQLEVDFVAPTGGTPAGTGRVTVVIAFW